LKKRNMRSGRKGAGPGHRASREDPHGREWAAANCNLRRKTNRVNVRGDETKEMTYCLRREKQKQRGTGTFRKIKGSNPGKRYGMCTSGDRKRNEPPTQSSHMCTKTDQLKHRGQKKPNLVGSLTALETYKKLQKRSSRVQGNAGKRCGLKMTLPGKNESR